MLTVDAAIHTALDGDVTLSGLVTGVYRGKAPDEATYPLVTFQQVSGDDRYVLAGRAFTRLLYQVIAIAAGDDQEPAADAAARADVLLNDQLAFMSCRRESLIEFVEQTAGQAYQHVGGTYRIFVEA